jgi:hypothetical protein
MNGAFVPPWIPRSLTRARVCACATVGSALRQAGNGQLMSIILSQCSRAVVVWTVRKGNFDEMSLEEPLKMQSI